MDSPESLTRCCKTRQFNDKIVRLQALLLLIWQIRNERIGITH